MKNWSYGTKNHVHGDLWLFILSCIASVIGLVLIYSATCSDSPAKYLSVQGLAIVIGIIAYAILSLTDISYVSSSWKLLYIANILLISSLFVFGIDGGTGNRSWIRFGSVGIQPAEIGKILLILTFAKHVSLLSKNLSSFYAVFRLCAHFIIISGLVFASSRDLGMVLAYIFISVVMLFTAGIDKKWIISAAVIVAAAAPLIWNSLGKFQQNRILVVINPSIDAATAWHAEQSKIALGSGQVLGTGYLQGNQTQFNRLPEKHTDFIFSVAGEEFGFVGCLVILIVLTAIIMRIFFIASCCDDKFSYLVCIGIGSMIMFQTIINVGMCVALTPVIGLTLPFISYGGSSVLTMFVSVGIVSGIKMKAKPQPLKVRT